MSRDLLPGCTGVLALADGTVLQGIGVGAVGEAVGEVCFNTAMTGYQEILTDPSYMAQIVAFTFPHVGNVGTNVADLEQMSGSAETAARGAIFRDLPTAPANWRAARSSSLIRLVNDCAVRILHMARSLRKVAVGK